MSIVDATKSKVIKGTPRINSMNSTHNILSVGIFDRRPSASAIPIGNEKVIPVIPRIRVSMMPPN